MRGARYQAPEGGNKVRRLIARWWKQYRLKLVRSRAGNVFIENGIWIIIVVLAMILPIEALRNALVGAFGQIVQNLNAIP
jgi:nitrate reductase NapE component